jgi:UDP-N-acetyl-D-galactosamine dehydrogenase
MKLKKDLKISVIGLGYVGLPLAIEFSKLYEVVGYDINADRIHQLHEYNDLTNETSSKSLKKALNAKLIFTSLESDLSNSDVFIVTVPTPITEKKVPDLSFLKLACKTVGSYLKPGDVVIFESTVFPGCTEEDCVPILQAASNLIYKQDFHCGYSPERINPGDKVNTLTKIKKITAGSSPEISDFVDAIYGSIIEAGTHKVSSIKVAEAAKSIENVQRDLNISLVNELSIIFDLLDIDTKEVIDAAATKWNFMKFYPGLVGGHCISVDPYYLTYRSKKGGYDPELISSGRKINENMTVFIANKILKMLLKNDIKIIGSKCLILGVTFKENCSDIRNSKVPKLYRELEEFGINVDIYDPKAIQEEVFKEFKIKLVKELDQYDSIILAVGHHEFKQLNYNDLKRNPSSIIYDIKSFLDKEIVDARL